MKSFISLPRVMDEGQLCFDVSQVKMVAANADESGIIEGTAAIYLSEGLAIAVNMSVVNVVAVIMAAGQFAHESYMPVPSKEIN